MNVNSFESAFFITTESLYIIFLQLGIANKKTNKIDIDLTCLIEF